MAISLDQQFKTTSGSVDLTEKGSALSNGQTEVVTMQSIIDTVAAEGGAVVDYSADITSLQNADIAIAGALAALPTKSYFSINGYCNDFALATKLVLPLGGAATATDRLYGHGQYLLPVDCTLVGFQVRSENAAGLSSFEIHESSAIADNVNVSLTIDNTDPSFKEEFDLTLASTTVSGQVLTSAFTAGQALTVTMTSAAAPGKVRWTLMFKASIV